MREVGYPVFIWRTPAAALDQGLAITTALGLADAPAGHVEEVGRVDEWPAARRRTVTPLSRAAIEAFQSDATVIKYRTTFSV